MTPERQDLQNKIKNLHEELEGADRVDPVVRTHLLELLNEIEEKLAADSEVDEPHGVRERLDEAVQHFETSHPTLASTLGSIIDGLGQMGI